MVTRVVVMVARVAVMVVRVAVIPGVDVLDPNTGGVPIVVGPQSWGEPSREAGSGVCAINIQMGGRTMRGVRLAYRCCHSGPISCLSRRSRAISVGRCVEAQTGVIDRLRRRFALGTSQFVHDLTAGSPRVRNTRIHSWRLTLN